MTRYRDVRWERRQQRRDDLYWRKPAPPSDVFALAVIVYGVLLMFLALHVGSGS